MVDLKRRPRENKKLIGNLCAVQLSFSDQNIPRIFLEKVCATQLACRLFGSYRIHVYSGAPLESRNFCDARNNLYMPVIVICVRYVKRC